MRKSPIILLLLVLVGCKSTTYSDSALSGVPDAQGSQSDVMRIWNDYVKAETSGKTLQVDCAPRYMPAATGVAYQGTVVFFHGFTACPQQYFSIGGQLNALGYDVFLPLLPGHGRQPFDGPGGNKDNFRDLPSTSQIDRYRAFVATMNKLAAAATGNRIVVGLSGGGALAMGAAINGQGIWDRLLAYSPYLKNPGISGVASAIIDVFVPDYVNNWGKECRANRARPGGRAGLCALTVDNIRAMTNYGLSVYQDVDQITNPTQIAGVVADPTADDGQINRAFERLANAQLCFYPKGVPHSLINPKADAPELDPYWVPAMEDDSINFITHGSWFKTDGTSSEYGRPLCRSSL